MDSGYRSPLTDLFRRGEIPHDLRLLAAQGAISSSAHEQLAILVLLSDDQDADIADMANATLEVLPVTALQGFLARSDVPVEMKAFFAARGIAAASVPSAESAEPLLAPDDDDEDDELGSEGLENEEGASTDDAPKILSGLPVKKKMKLAFKGTREQRAQLIRDPNKIVAAAVLSSPKLTDAEVEAFAKMASVSEEVLRVIGTNRSWLKNYGTVLGLVKNPKTPAAISMHLLPRVTERDMKMISVDRNVPEALKLAARKFIVKGLK